MWIGLKPFELAWNSLNQFELVWFSENQLNWLEPFRTGLNQYQWVWTTLNHFEPVLIILIQLRNCPLVLKLHQWDLFNAYLRQTKFDYLLNLELGWTLRPFLTQSKFDKYFFALKFFYLYWVWVRSEIHYWMFPIIKSLK